MLLRGVVGITTVAQMGTTFLSHNGWTMVSWIAVLLLAACGICLLIGFLTPIASASVAIGSLCFVFSWLPAPPSTPFENHAVPLNMLIMAAAIALLGPGAFSLDSYLFGRREVVISRR